MCSLWAEKWSNSAPLTLVLGAEFGLYFTPTLLAPDKAGCFQAEHNLHNGSLALFAKGYVGIQVSDAGDMN